MIETARLKLLPLSRNQLEFLLLQPDRLITETGIPLSGNLTAGRVENAIRMKLEKMNDSSMAHHIWITYWLLVIKSDLLGAGLLGFKGFPDENGVVEIGYGINPSSRSKGYMTEAVKSLAGWAFSEPTCRIIVAPQTLKANPASNRVLEKVGMQIYEETGDAYSWKLDRSLFDQGSRP